MTAHKPLARQWPLRQRIVVAMVAGFVVVGAMVIFHGHAAVRPIGKLSPATGSYWGTYTYNVIADRETQVGRKFAIHQKFYDFTNNFPGTSEADDVANGRIPLDTWQPQTNGTTPLSANTNADIANGVFDSTITTRAQAFRAFGHPVFLRYAPEMNGSWEKWNGATNGTSADSFVAAWRHVHDLFVRNGATNVVWVWCPNATDVPSATTAPWNHWTNYYPGDAYVDWAGIDGYNWGNTATGSTWQTFAQVFGNGTSGVYADYASIKPIMIAEFGSAFGGAPAGTSKAQWMTDMATTIQTKFPSIEAVVYFDTVSSSGTAQWPIDTDPNSLSAYTADGQQAYFNPAINMGTTGDLNLDNQVNVFDLSILLSDWAATNNSIADLNHDGIVNIFDLSTLLSHWTS
jgi:beta-mannanase